MAFYEDMQDIATDLISKFGQSGSLIRRQISNYDPTTGSYTTTPATQAVSVFIYPYIIRAVDHERGGIVEKQVLRAYISGSLAGGAPQKGDYVVVGGSKYVIDTVENLSPAGTDVLYTCQILN